MPGTWPFPCWFATSEVVRFTRRPPRRDPPRTHSCCSRIHLSQGGRPGSPLLYLNPWGQRQSRCLKTFLGNDVAMPPDSDTANNMAIVAMLWTGIGLSLAEMPRLGGCRRDCGVDIDGLLYDLQITARFSLSTVKTSPIGPLFSFTLLARLGMAARSWLCIALRRARWIGIAVAAVRRRPIHRFVVQRTVERNE